jgi:hypothetical protein
LADAGCLAGFFTVFFFVGFIRPRYHASQPNSRRF